ncbi:cyclopropane mycolic acid synthase family methyltransferase [Gordonia soli]|uniref:Cyclopropane fatty acid synthase n=1 Tax=Gordonia soli NBRC 108243 TaxID=1223545 RepID=M0QJ81_9ACTN|nr:cyclopropane mycolic acid synthase family methyltransferase [Gordonia soli]GAC68685.1 cyclopropane fatty acid synthase [Gordonia soli NBRC 108243]
MTEMRPFYSNVQSHYDLSDDFFALFLDPSRTYSCAYFERDDYTLGQAQQAKVDLALGKCDLKPGQTLLDIGCGWGATMLRAIEQYDVNVIGLTLSRNQHDHVAKQFHDRGYDPSRARVHLRGWEEFDEPVDRVVSIGAFEHFRRERYDLFFAKYHGLLPDDGRMLLHTIVGYNRHQLRDRGLTLARADLEFLLFILKNIFPGGQIPEPQWIVDGAEAVGFTTQRVHPLNENYAKTLDLWAAALRERRDDAIALTDEATYDTYERYLSGCGHYFRTGFIDVMQFTLAKGVTAETRDVTGLAE